MEFRSQVVSKTYSILFSANHWPYTMNVRNKPLYDMACVVKLETPLEWRWKLFEFQEKAYQFRE